MADFSFEAKLVTVVRVRAAVENVARAVVPTVLRAPGTVELRLANEGNAVIFKDAIVTNVDFSVEEGSIKLIETDGVPAPAPAIRPPNPHASRRNGQLRSRQSKIDRKIKKPRRSEGRRHDRHPTDVESHGKLF
jgi:hypothetical protein